MREFIAQRWRQGPQGPAFVAELAGKYPDLIDLSIGDPDLQTPQELIDRAFADASAGHTKYTDPWGDPELRAEIVRFYEEEYHVSLCEEEVFITAAGCVAMFLVMAAVLDAGDEVLVFEPYFSPYAQQVRLGGGVPVFVPCREEDGWQPDAERAQRAVTPRTKAMILNTPNNPTGACYTRQTMEALAAFAQKNDLLVVTDDIYTSFCYDAPFAPMLALPEMRERTVAINSFSKNFIMTGFRVGNIVAPRAIARTVKAINENVVYTAPAPSQRAAIQALQNRRRLSAGIVPEFAARMALGAQRIRSLPGFTLSPASGGIYLFPGIRQTGLSSAEMCEALLEKAHVLALPGSLFGSAGEGYLRIACTVGTKQLAEAFDRIAALSFSLPAPGGNGAL